MARRAILFFLASLPVGLARRRHAGALGEAVEAGSAIGALCSGCSRGPGPRTPRRPWPAGSGRPATLGALDKRAEAMIALLNPRWSGSCATLDGAEIVLEFRRRAGLRWSATVPGDDGTFAALATAMALSGGGPEGPIGKAFVDRLGPPGSALIAREGASVVAGGSREEVERALARLPLAHDRGPRRPPRPRRSGRPRRARPPAPSPDRGGPAMLSAAGRSGGTSGSMARPSLLVMVGRFAAPIADPKPVDPSWLDWVPADRVVGAFCTAIDPRPAAWEARFAAADRAEKADPARASSPRSARDWASWPWPPGCVPRPTSSTT